MKLKSQFEIERAIVTLTKVVTRMRKELDSEMQYSGVDIFPDVAAYVPAQVALIELLEKQEQKEGEQHE
jgi:hypothetical protein